MNMRRSPYLFGGATRPTGRRSVPYDPGLAAYLQSFPRNQRIKQKELAGLMERYRSGSRQARDRIVYGNIGLVIKIAQRLVGLGIPFHELIQEGIIGLMRSMETFDISRGYRFGTYAQFWILQGCLSAFEQEGCIGNVPYGLASNRRVEFLLVKRVLASIPEQEDGSSPNAKTILTWIKKLSTKVAEKMTHKKVERALRLVQSSLVSFNAPIPASDDGEATLAEFIPAEGTDPVDMIAVRQIVQTPDDARALVQKLLTGLTERHAAILRLRFGLGEESPMAYSGIAKRFGLSRERIRQIKNEVFQIIQKRFLLKSDELTMLFEALAELGAPERPPSQNGPL